MKTFLRQLVIFGGATAALILLVIVGWSAWQHIRDPLAALDYGQPALTLLTDSTYTVRHGNTIRTYHDIAMTGDRLDTIRCTLSLPSQMRTGERLPLLLVIGGLEIGRESLRYVENHGRNALIAYEYPYTPEYWYQRDIPLSDFFTIQDAVFLTPSQLVALTRWALAQEWADTSRVSMFSYSFGVAFLPSAFRLAASYNINYNGGVMIYGGADIRRLLHYTTNPDDNVIKGLGVDLVASAIHPVEPSLHLPSIHGKFLLINGSRDNLIPEESIQLLHKLTPEPKTVFTLETGHMAPSASKLLKNLVERCRRWLLDHSLINP